MRKLDGFLTLAAAILRSWTALAISGARIIAECPEAWPWYVNVTVRLLRIFDALRPSGRASPRKPLESRIPDLPSPQLRSKTRRGAYAQANLLLVLNGSPTEGDTFS